MSGVWNDLVKGSVKIGHAFGFGKVTDKVAGKAFGYKPPVKPVPGVPTVDQAAANESTANRLRQRRGVLATMFGGTGGGTPSSVGTKSLTGQ